MRLARLPLSGNRAFCPRLSRSNRTSPVDTISTAMSENPLHGRYQQRFPMANKAFVPCRRMPKVPSDSGALLADLPEETQQVAAPELVDALLVVTAPQHRIRDHRKVADIAHAASQGGSSVEVGAERNVVLTNHLDGFVHYCYPIVDRHHDRVRRARARHRELRCDHLVHFIDRLALHSIRN